MKKQLVQALAKTAGFDGMAITTPELGHYEARYFAWLKAGYQGEMAYLERHGTKRTRPDELVPGTQSVIVVRQNYLPAETALLQTLNNKNQAYISRYALGRDYHKVLRGKLKRFVQALKDADGDFQSRVFTDSAPVLEKPFAEKAGLGWIGKHTNLIDRQQGSWFFLGVVYTDLVLEPDPPTQQSHCGSCSACMTICPTQAIIAPYVLDATRCISYLTIELQGEIPLEFRRAIGNRIYGCDDCQLVCPWNKFANTTNEPDFAPRHQLQSQSLLDLFAWDEITFLQKTEGSAIRRIGHASWLRNIAIALGNAPYDETIVHALNEKRHDCAPLVATHIDWALEEQQIKRLA